MDEECDDETLPEDVLLVETLPELDPLDVADTDNVCINVTDRLGNADALTEVAPLELPRAIAVPVALVEIAPLEDTAALVLPRAVAVSLSAVVPVPCTDGDSLPDVVLLGGPVTEIVTL